MENEIRDEFLTELLETLEKLNNKTVTKAESELMYRVVSSVNENIKFTN